MVIKPLANTVNLATAKNVYLATAVLITNGDTAARTVALANTGGPTELGQHGSYAGGKVSVHVPAAGMVILRKRPYDTVNAGSNTVFATKVADTGN
jgi:hypothetical protein